MPLDYDLPASPNPAHPPVSGPSAAITLSGTMCSACGGSGDLDATMVEAIMDFWGDGYGVLTELTALAHATGHIDGVDIDPFLDRLLDPVVFDSPLPFETETDDERDAANARLHRLALHGTLRTRYVALLRVMWGLIEPTWETEAVPRAVVAQVQWRDRLDRGDDLLHFSANHGTNFFWSKCLG